MLVGKRQRGVTHEEGCYIGECPFVLRIDNKERAALRAAPHRNTSVTNLTGLTSWGDYFTINFLTMFTCSPLMRTK